jgi:high-affinity Fe2+/Pb2+ permease
MFYVNSLNKCIVGESNMNKYALTLPLVILSVLLGYFGSSLQMEYAYAIVAATVILAAIVGYLFLKIPQRRPKQNATVNK